MTVKAFVISSSPVHYGENDIVDGHQSSRRMYLSPSATWVKSFEEAEVISCIDDGKGAPLDRAIEISEAHQRSLGSGFKVEIHWLTPQWKFR